MNCTHDCNSCGGCPNPCPKCGGKGMTVPSITVLSLTDKMINLDDEYFLCLNNKCDVAYYNDKFLSLATETKKPIWFKAKYFEYIVCYCRDIYLKDVVKVCFDLEGVLDTDILIRTLKKENVTTNCLVNNPTGTSCERLLENAIAYAKDIYKQSKEEDKNEK